LAGREACRAFADVFSSHVSGKRVDAAEQKPVNGKEAIKVEAARDWAELKLRETSLRSKTSSLSRSLMQRSLMRTEVPG
jgi:hypothetical protein